VRIGLLLVRALGEAGARAARERAGAGRSLRGCLRTGAAKRIGRAHVVRTDRGGRLRLVRQAAADVALASSAWRRATRASPARPERSASSPCPCRRQWPRRRYQSNRSGSGCSPTYPRPGFPPASTRSRCSAASFRPHLSALDLPAAPDGSRVTVAGMVVARQRPPTANGVTFLLLEDETGQLNVIVMPQLYAGNRALVRGEPDPARARPPASAPAARSTSSPRSWRAWFRWRAGYLRAPTSATHCRGFTAFTSDLATTMTSLGRKRARGAFP